MITAIYNQLAISEKDIDIHAKIEHSYWCCLCTGISPPLEYLETLIAFESKCRRQELCNMASVHAITEAEKRFYGLEW